MVVSGTFVSTLGAGFAVEFAIVGLAVLDLAMIGAVSLFSEGALTTLGSDRLLSGFSCLLENRKHSATKSLVREIRYRNSS